jgi:tetratricopeptide (TPR) repeat protein
MKRHIKAVLIFLLIFAVFASLPANAQQPTESKSLKQQAAELIDEGKYIDALPILERIAANDPKDADTQFYLGISLLAQSNAVRDKTSVIKLRLRARQAFVKAKQLGSTNDLLEAFIEGIPENGSLPPQYSENFVAEELMRQGETEFAQGNFDEAIDLYKKALEADPKLYSAALYVGDSYLRKKDHANAEIWYQKAINIDPTRETAYRYSATPLMEQEKYNEARDRYVEAFIVEPYSKLARLGLVRWGEVTGTDLRHPQIDIPANISTGKNGDINITLGLGDEKDDGSFAWTAYGLARATWQSGKEGLSDDFKKAYPKESKYRHSLAEEFDALKTAAVILKERMKDKDSPVKKLNPQLKTLIELHDKGLLEAYILLAIPDNGIAQDHAGYLKTNRAKLRQYVMEYVIQK